MTELTVIVPVRNGERFLSSALDSVFDQTFTHFSVVVVDDGSTDATASILSRYTDSRLTVLRQSYGQGPAAARNRALDAARTPYVAFMDSDDVAEPHRFEVQVRTMQRRPDIGLLGGRIAVIDADARATPEVRGYAGPDAALSASLLFRNGIATSTVMIAADALGAERFDPSLAVASDYDMWLRVANRTKIACLPDVLVRYRDHSGNVTHTREAESTACVERVIRRQLRHLGITPSDQQVALHLALGFHRLDGATASLPCVAAWLDTLEAACASSRVYDREAVAAVLADEWMAACDAVTSAGRWSAWRAIAGSRWTGRAAIAPAVRRQLAATPWRTARGYVRRRWPGAGTRARAWLSGQRASAR
jgi:glycosyl transferase family 2